MKKIIIAIILVVGFVSTGFSQSDKLKAKIDKKIDKINASIVSSDKDAALTDEQRTKIFAVLFETSKAVKKIKKENKGADNLKELMKAENKKANKTINKEILTKEQKKAKKQTRENKKKK